MTLLPLALRSLTLALGVAACSNQSDSDAAAAPGGMGAVGGAGSGGTSAGAGGMLGGAGGAVGGAGGTSAGSGGVGGGSGADGGAGAAGGGGGGGSGAGAGGEAGAGGTGGALALAIVSDTNRDGQVDQNDAPNQTEWAWQGAGAFLIANVDDDDENAEVDAADAVVNGAEDEADLARIHIKVSPEALAKSTSISATLTAGAAQVHLFEKSGSSWSAVAGALSALSAESELGVEATQFADVDWDGFVTLSVELHDAAQSVVETQQVKLRVAPWLMLPNSAPTEAVYILDSETSTDMRAGVDAALAKIGMPACLASDPGGADQWFQDTMEIGFTQLPGKPPMHVVMKAQRRPDGDNVALTLLAPNFGFISIGETRNLSGDDGWMDWMGNLEVSHPVPGYPFGRVYYGHSNQTTFHPDIVKFIEAQELQKPFTIYTEWLVIQHVDEVMNFVPGSDGKPRMIIVSPEAANAVLNADFDADQELIQGYIDEITNIAKTELGLADSDIIRLPVYFQGSGLNFVPKWSSPVNSIYVNGTVIIGQTSTPDAIKTDIEAKFDALGIKSAWVDDANYHSRDGNVHCGTNTRKTPLCANFAQCL